MQRPTIRVWEQNCPLRCHRGDSSFFICIKACANRRSHDPAKRTSFFCVPEANGQTQHIGHHLWPVGRSCAAAGQKDLANARPRICQYLDMAAMFEGDTFV
jgi:hypothetical protein